MERFSHPLSTRRVPRSYTDSGAFLVGLGGILSVKHIFTIFYNLISTQVQITSRSARPVLDAGALSLEPGL